MNETKVGVDASCKIFGECQVHVAMCFYRFIWEEPFFKIEVLLVCISCMPWIDILLIVYWFFCVYLYMIDKTNFGWLYVYN